MQQKTAGLCSFGGCLGGLGARALMPLVRLGQRTKSKNKKRYVLACFSMYHINQANRHTTRKQCIKIANIKQII
ncbi:MAG: hypothetical protein RSD57_07610 [Comamonas sp.]